MANRTYVVKKNGEIIKELKSLSAAKKIAQAENAEVYCGDEMVYSSSDGEKEETGTVETEAHTTVEKQVDDGAEKQIDESAEKQIDDGAEKQIDDDAEKRIDGVEMKYRLKALMNVRVSPSFSSRKIATLPPGTIVAVANIKNDWLHLTNGTFIFYGNGKYAEKVQ